MLGTAAIFVEGLTSCEPLVPSSFHTLSQKPRPTDRFGLRLIVFRFPSQTRTRVEPAVFEEQLVSGSLLVRDARDPANASEHSYQTRFEDAEPEQIELARPYVCRLIIFNR